MSNGLVLDDGGFTVSIGAATLQDGDGNGGGLVKKGYGTVYLDNQTETYTGTTVVSNGMLAGTASITGPVVVAPLGTLGAGDAGSVGTFTINNNLTLNGNAAMRVDKTSGSPASDQVAVLHNVTYGGILTITNITSNENPITTNDTFQIFNVSGNSYNNFTSIVGSPGAGLAYSFNPANGVLSVVTAPTLSWMQFISSPVISGTSLTISATNMGAGTVYLLTSTNAAAPINTWTCIWTNVLSGSGSFTTNVANAVNPAWNQEFYILSNTNN
jgi:autotransporter-associated beta strand protein